MDRSAFPETRRQLRQRRKIHAATRRTSSIYKGRSGQERPAPTPKYLRTSSVAGMESPLFFFPHHLRTRYVHVGQSDKEVSILLRALPETKGEMRHPPRGVRP